MYVCPIYESCMSIHTSCEYSAIWFVPMVQKLLLHDTMVVVVCGGIPLIRCWHCPGCQVYRFPGAHNTIKSGVSRFWCRSVGNPALFKHKDCQLRKLCGQWCKTIHFQVATTFSGWNCGLWTRNEPLAIGLGRRQTQWRHFKDVLLGWNPAYLLRIRTQFYRNICRDIVTVSDSSYITHTRMEGRL